MASPRQALTLLHLSDPQFGAHHREAEGRTAADREHDSLQARLLQDLAEITKDGAAPRPELVVVTGDLSEWALPSEFAAFEAFATTLLDGLGLPRQRLVMVPGNHDVSWSDCKAYFEQCEAEGREPVPPYTIKWRAYAELCARWYGAQSPSCFTEQRPFSLFVFEELHTVVAGLNSTMPETHRDGEHHGGVGEDQLRWFRAALAPYHAQGWLRIAAVHHNVQRKAVDDDENLHDANYLELLLGDEINLVLHGHTHDGKRGWLGPDVPIVSTGSAAVKHVARPHGVPCQYQLIRVHAAGLQRWTRAYNEAQRRWIGDTAASRRGDDWRHEHPVTFKDLGVLASALPTPSPVPLAPAPTRLARPGAAPKHTAIVLDRTEAWAMLTRTIAAAPSHMVFVVYGTWHQDLELFTQRIATYFNEEAAARHQLLVVDPSLDGSRPVTAEDWGRAVIAATETKQPPLKEALFEATYERAALLVLSDGGPLRAVDSRENDALVAFLAGLLPATLATQALRGQVRVVVPIELPDDGSTELVLSIQRELGRSAQLELHDKRLELPDWPEIEKSLHLQARRMGITWALAQLDRCKARYESIVSTTPVGHVRMAVLGDGMHELYVELRREAMRSQPPRP